MVRRLPLFISCALLAGAAQAAELGEARVSSFLGQPLVADIELTMLDDAATPVAVRLAHPNVYRGANIGMPPVLSSLRMSVMRRDGRQFLHLTSLGPVEAEHLHLYLELADGSQRSVRLATLWLTPDPTPAPPPPTAAAPVVPVVAVKAAEPAPRQEPKPAPRPAPVAARPKPVVAPPRAAELVPARSEAPGACAPAVQQQVDACVALGAKNALLREQLGELENKVKVLQVAAGAAPASPAQPVKTHKLKKKPAPEPEAATPWRLIGAATAGVLLLLAGLVLVRRRRRKAQWRALEPTLEPGAHESSTQV